MESWWRTAPESPATHTNRKNRHPTSNCQTSPPTRPTSSKSWIWAPAKSVWRRRRESHPCRKAWASRRNIRAARANSIKVQNRTCLTLSTRIMEIWTNSRLAISQQNKASDRSQRQEWPWTWPRTGYRWARTWRQMTSAWSKRNLKRRNRNSYRINISPSESASCNRWMRSPLVREIARVKSHCLR